MNYIMTKEEVDYIILNNYPKLIKCCDYLYCEIESNIEILFGSPKEDNNKFFKNNDYRIEPFTRLLSVVVNIKMSLYLFNSFIEKQSWEKDYFSNILNYPSIDNYYGFLYDLDTDYRFLFYTQFFSQIESYAREVTRYENKEKFHFPEFLKKGADFDDKFIEFAEAIRNSIHNNGYFFPYKQMKQTVTYESITINKGDKLDFFSWEYAFEFCSKLLKHFSATFYIEK